MFDFLIAPLRVLISALGTGVLPAGGATAALTQTQTALNQAAELSTKTPQAAAAGWQGTGGDAVTRAAAQVQRVDTRTGDDGAEIAKVIETAASRVQKANAELNSLADSFVTAADAVAPTLTPVALMAVVPIAVEHVARGVAVVNKTQAELAGDAAAVGRHQAAATTTTGARLGTPTADGHIPVRLPDGSIAYAPNERAARAVQAALSQQGTPYVWGGTQPGGFDCSGLTQWSYRQAGLELPRLAQEQDTAGVPVSQSELQPGDLAVWSGHVAMIVGNGQMVEAGDPVQVGPIRTTNMDQTFEGFYRPR
ncbi:MAG: C40 family peptidase [Gordonia sp. (in: high G+C Gram-positive bacteria)]